MREGSEPRHAWLHYVSFAILLQRRVDFRPQILVAGFRSANRIRLSTAALVAHDARGVRGSASD